MDIKTAHQAPTIEVERHRLARAMAHMPYAGGIATGQVDLNGDALIAWLEQLTDRLRQAADRHAEADAELRELQQQRRAVRAFLGTEAVPE